MLGSIERTTGDRAYTVFCCAYTTIDKDCYTRGKNYSTYSHLNLLVFIIDYSFITNRVSVPSSSSSSSEIPYLDICRIRLWWRWRAQSLIHPLSIMSLRLWSRWMFLFFKHEAFIQAISSYFLLVNFRFFRLRSLPLLLIRPFQTQAFSCAVGLMARCWIVDGSYSWLNEISHYTCRSSVFRSFWSALPRSFQVCTVFLLTSPP